MPTDEDRASAQPEAKAPSLGDAVRRILEEARMILPGTQTLFGCQLIVVFNPTSQDRLSAPERSLHLVAAAQAVAAALLLDPAAYHRRVEPRSVAERFVACSARLLTWGPIPLLLAVCADFYLVATLVTRQWAASLALALGPLAVFVWLWVLLPARQRGDRQRGDRERGEHRR